MIRLHIKNFQNIEQAEIEVSGVTLLVGNNNQGKSAIVRALLAALFNRAGKGFIRDGSRKCTVGVEIEAEPDFPALTLTWTKTGKAGGSYIVNGETYSKLGREVPQPIPDAGIKEIKVGTQKARLQFWGQWEPPFLVSEPGSYLFEFFSRFRKESHVGRAVVKMKEDLRTWESEARTLESNIALVEQATAQKVEEANKYRAIAEHSDDIESFRSALVSEFNHILQVASNHIRTEKALEDTTNRMTRLQGGRETLTEALQQLEDLEGDHDSITTLFLQHTAIVRQIRYNELRLSVLVEYRATFLEVENLEEMASLLRRLRQNQSQLTGARRSLAAKRDEKRRYSDLLNQAVAACGGVCPLCNQPIQQ